MNSELILIVDGPDGQELERKVLSFPNGGGYAAYEKALSKAMSREDANWHDRAFYIQSGSRPAFTIPLTSGKVILGMMNFPNR